MNMDRRFASASQLGPNNHPDAAGNRDTSHEDEAHRQATSITLDENLSRLFECMRLEYGT